MPSSTPTASVMAVSSPALVFERLSHAADFSSHAAVSSSRNAWSAVDASTSGGNRLAARHCFARALCLSPKAREILLGPGLAL